MKLLITSILFFLSLAAQVKGQDTKLLATGTLNGGSIYAINVDGSPPEKWVDLSGGLYPHHSLIYYENKLWGMTRGGGAGGFGTIFNLDLDGSNYTKVHDFDGVNGKAPSGCLVASNGKLWGMTSKGGIADMGVIFSIEPLQFSFTKEYDLTGENGNDPDGSFIRTNGKLWGMTARGGAKDNGVIFNINLDGSDFTKIYEFEDADNGRLPVGSLLESNGKLWGMASFGGLNNYGAIFSINLDGTDYTKIHDFSHTDGYYPEGTLVEGNGKLWGVTGPGGTANSGVIFRLNPDGTNFEKVHDFDGLDNGKYPNGNLTVSNDKIWGTTQSGGIHESGIVFNLDMNNSTFMKMYDFDQTTVYSGLKKHNGKLWGVTYSGIYNLDNDGTNYVEIHEFSDSSPNGHTPHDLVEFAGRLWGTTSHGGVNNLGVIFSLALDGTNYTKVYDFNLASGAAPNGALIGFNDRLWGMTSRGGSNNKGTIFSMDVNSLNYSKIHDFVELTGSNPYGSLIEIDGKLWGMTHNGGLNDKGVIFSTDLSGSNYTKIYDFSDLTGSNPYGSLIKSNGKFWGMTVHGGLNGSGVIFMLDLDGKNYTKVHDFDDVDGIDGQNPYGNLLEHNGKLWGVTSIGGFQNHGIIFNIDLDGTNFKRLHLFNEINGSWPRGNLVESNEKLWGITLKGGANDQGVVFNLNADGSNFSVVHQLDPMTAGGRSLGSLIKLKSEQSIDLIVEDKKYGDDIFIVHSTSNTANPITYSSSDTNILSIDGSSAIINGSGNVIITATQVEDINYRLGTASQQISIAKATLTATADDKSKFFGELNPELTISYSGFMDTDNESNIDTPPTASTSANQTSAPGNYEILLTGGKAANYSFELVNGVMSVDAVLGLEDHMPTGMILHPNPAYGYFRINSESDLIPNKVIISNVSGQVEITVNNPTEEIDIQTLSKGLYIVKIYWTDRAETVKLIKAN